MKAGTISIRTIISIMMAVMLMILVIAVIISVNAFLTRAITDILVRSTNEIITQINTNVESYITDITDIAAYARNLARDTSAIDADDITSRLLAIMESRDDIVRIEAFGTDGELLLTTSPSGSDATGNELWFTRAMKGEGDFFFTGPVLETLPSGQESLVITYSQLISYGDMNRATSPAILVIDLNFRSISISARSGNFLRARISPHRDTSISSRMTERLSTIPDRKPSTTDHSKRTSKVLMSMSTECTSRSSEVMRD